MTSLEDIEKMIEWENNLFNATLKHDHQIDEVFEIIYDPFPGRLLTSVRMKS